MHYDEQPRDWYLFQLPESVVAVPVDGPVKMGWDDAEIAAARESLRETCYRGAPVNDWPVIGKLGGSRASLFDPARNAVVQLRRQGMLRTTV